MRAMAEMQFGEIKCVVREMTVGEVRAWLKSSITATDALDFDLVENIALRDLQHVTDLTPEAVDALTPKQVASIRDKARELNPDFFAFRARLFGLAKSIALDPQNSKSPTSSEPSLP